MPKTGVTPPLAKDDHPSLIEGVARRRGALIAVPLLALLVGVGAWATVERRGLTRETETLRARAEMAQADSIEQTSGRRAAPLPAATLDRLAAHLPPGQTITAIEARPGGILRITMRTPDPDALRAALSADPWLAGFRERSQDQDADGGFLVVLESR